jgi:hypothetical protein
VIDGPEPPTATGDTGLRRVLTWTLVALVLSILMAFAGVSLVIHWFDRP